MNTRVILSAVITCITAASLAGVSFAQDKPAAAPPEIKRPDDKPADMGQKVKVFILLGQSNMVGLGKVGGPDGSLEFAVKEKKKYPYLVDDAGAWLERKDVRFARVMSGRGGGMQQFNNEWMTVRTCKTIGPEFGIAAPLGNAVEAPVLILKSCIGNRSLGWDLLPPGSERYTIDGTTYAGYKDTPDKWIEGQPKKEVPWYAGKQYDDDVKNAQTVLSEIGKYYPGATEYEVAGFLWWQGHKDQNAAHAGRYELNLVNLIKSLRKDLNAPDAKFVVATGCGNQGRESFGLQIAEAQLAVDGDSGKHPEFKGNVKSVDTRDFWREVDVSPKNQGYHYNRNAGTYMEVGNAMGWAMADLMKATQ